MNTLIGKARRLGKHNTNKEALRVALEQYIQKRELLRILEFFGTIDYDPDYDYRRERRRKRIGHLKPR